MIWVMDSIPWVRCASGNVLLQHRQPLSLSIALKIDSSHEGKFFFVSHNLRRKRLLSRATSVILNLAWVSCLPSSSYLGILQQRFGQCNDALLCLKRKRRWGKSGSSSRQKFVFPLAQPWRGESLSMENIHEAHSHTSHSQSNSQSFYFFFLLAKYELQCIQLYPKMTQ